MEIKPTALSRLIESTLSSTKGLSHRRKKYQKLSKSEKKLRLKKRREIKEQRKNASADSENDPVTDQSIERLNRLRAGTPEQNAEIESLQNSILEDLVTSVTYAKHQNQLSKEAEEDSDSDEDLPASWRGLPPGLAPVGYESSDDDEPY